ncbi:MAG: TonB family protein [Candidatus Methylomirabilia bacterium]
MEPSPPPQPPAPVPSVERPPEPSPLPPEVVAKPAPEPPAPELEEAPEPEDSRIALNRPERDFPPSRPPSPGSIGPGGGGGLFQRGRGGFEGEPIPLDTPDPRYREYFERVRRRIKAKWIYPREVGDRGIGGQLVIEFVIAKTGDLTFVELRRSSGVELLDLYALNAVRLAQPFPPIPDSVSRGVVGIMGIFTYRIVDARLLKEFFR